MSRIRSSVAITVIYVREEQLYYYIMLYDCYCVLCCRLAGYPWETDRFLRVRGDGGLRGMETFITGDHWRYPDT